MNFADLASLPEDASGTCFECREVITDATRTSAKHIRPDGVLHPLCQNCFRADDILKEPPKP